MPVSHWRWNKKTVEPTFCKDDWSVQEPSEIIQEAKKSVQGHAFFSPKTPGTHRNQKMWTLWTLSGEPKMWTLRNWLPCNLQGWRLGRVLYVRQVQLNWENLQPLMFTGHMVFCDLFDSIDSKNYKCPEKSVCLLFRRLFLFVKSDFSLVTSPCVFVPYFPELNLDCLLNPKFG
jgi:hypothetical protein